MNYQQHCVYVHATNGHGCAGHLTEGMLDHQIHAFLAHFHRRGWSQFDGGSYVICGDEHGELAICMRSIECSRRQLPADIKEGSD